VRGCAAVREFRAFGNSDEQTGASSFVSPRIGPILNAPPTDDGWPPWLRHGHALTLSTRHSIVRSVVVPSAIVRMCRLRARDSQRELCGYLYGRIRGEVAHVSALVGVENAASGQYEAVPAMPPASSHSGDQYLGFYHTHPGAPLPSAGDVECMRSRLGELWLIGGFPGARLDRPRTGRFTLCAAVTEPASIRYLEVIDADIFEAV
jgi:proteasome lid subunit RPN8/RPN11